MLFKSKIILAVAAASCVFQGTFAARDKANEYQSEDCSGDLNYGHVGLFLDSDITMDDTTHSVYLASSTDPESGLSVFRWQAYTDKTEDGGFCTGTKLGGLQGECHNIDTAFSQRAKCLRLCEVFRETNEPFYPNGYCV